MTSPPYFGLRDYGTATWEGGDADCDHAQEPPRFNGDKQTHAEVSGHASKAESNGRTHCHKCGARRIDAQIGLEASPDAYVAELVKVFREVRRVLADDGVIWINLGDSFAASGRGGGGGSLQDGDVGTKVSKENSRRNPIAGYKAKDLIGIPWMLAFALRADGWYLRSEIIWHKPNPMPESVTDRPTKSHEQIFLLTKNQRYFYDADAIAEPVTDSTVERLSQATLDQQIGSDRANGGAKSNGNMKAVGRLRKSDLIDVNGRNPQSNGKEADRRDEIGGTFCNNPRLRGGDGTRNKRSVWTVTTKPFSGALTSPFSLRT